MEYSWILCFTQKKYAQKMQPTSVAGEVARLWQCGMFMEKTNLFLWGKPYLILHELGEPLAFGRAFILALGKKDRIFRLSEIRTEIFYVQM